MIHPRDTPLKNTKVDFAPRTAEMHQIAGLFRTTRPHTVSEKHAGVTIETDLYWFLAIYGGTNLVGLYGSHKHSYENYYSMSFKQRGQITTLKRNCIVLSIRNPFDADEVIFEGVFMEDCRKLQLRARNGTTHEVVWPDETYERIDVPVPA